jgi:hypothetical protein
MADKDELAKRRHDKLVARVEDLMCASLKPEYEGFFGSVTLAEADVEDLGGDAGEIRRAARAAGQHLGWKTVTREIDGAHLHRGRPRGAAGSTGPGDAAVCRRGGGPHE